MSRQNVEVVRAALEAWNAGDMDALREVHDPDVIARPPEGWPGGAAVGWGAVLRRLKELRETWDADIAEPASDFIDAADRVVVKLVWRGTGRGTEVTALFTVHSGRIFEVEFFWDHAEALEAAGLRE